MIGIYVYLYIFDMDNVFDSDCICVYMYVCIGNSMVSSAIWEKMHERVFKRRSKLHESEGRETYLLKYSNETELSYIYIQLIQKGLSLKNLKL